MTLIVETGAGVLLANGYCTVNFVDSYLAARGRSTENRWNAKQPAQKGEFIIAGTDYIERAWSGWFRGIKEFSFDQVFATATVTFAGLPADTETLTLGDHVYTFVTALSGSADEVLIGADADATASNLNDAINKVADNEGTTFGSGTLPNRHATSTAASAVVTLTASADGASGNDTTLTETAANTTVTAFTGGKDGGSQPLSFPRRDLYDASGRLVRGVPAIIKQATAEYSVRAAGLTNGLMPDPTTDARGGTVQRLREKVGPLETETEYVPGTALSGRLTPYPAADRLIRQFTTPRGMAIR